LRDNANFRDDAYGGPVANRIRLLREVAEAVCDTIGAEHTGVRLSPNGDTQGVNDSDPETLFSAAAAALSGVGIAYLELREPGFEGSFGRADRPPVAPAIRATFKGPLILNSDYDGARGQQALDSGVADAIAFGRTFIANPDLPRRLAEHIELAKDDAATWYSQGPHGYTDYPTAG
jgi:2,4-dienoyl-CoA reductase-like NADH-dependent reductase (Old Yellow Enzyme family)